MAGLSTQSPRVRRTYTACRLQGCPRVQLQGRGQSGKGGGPWIYCPPRAGTQRRQVTYKTKRKAAAALYATVFDALTVP